MEHVDELEAPPVKKRAQRRAQRARKVAWARRVLVTWSFKLVEADVDRLSRKLADHLQSCSCWMCGNSRKHFGATYAERRAMQPVGESDD